MCKHDWKGVGPCPWCARRWQQTNNPTEWEPITEELARFNDARARLLNGKPPVGGIDRMPLPHSGVGGDIPENG